MVESDSGENFGNWEAEEKYLCLCCNASEEECGAILMVKTRLKQKEDKEAQVKEEEVTVKKEANRLNIGEDLYRGCLTKSMYETILARNLTFSGFFNPISRGIACQLISHVWGGGGVKSTHQWFSHRY